MGAVREAYTRRERTESHDAVAGMTTKRGAGEAAQVATIPDMDATRHLTEEIAVGGLPSGPPWHLA